MWALEERDRKRVRDLSKKDSKLRDTQKIKIFVNLSKSLIMANLNAGGRPNTCKSNGNREEACFFC